MDIIPETITIEGRKYLTRKMGARTAMALHGLTLATFGSNAGNAINNVNSSDFDSLKTGITAIVSMLGSANHEKLYQLQEMVLAEIQPEGGNMLRGPEIDLHFNQYPGDLYPVFAWGLILNVSPFFSSAVKNLSSVAEALGWSSPKTTKTSGPSTGRLSKVVSGPHS